MYVVLVDDLTDQGKRFFALKGRHIKAQGKRRPAASPRVAIASTNLQP